MTLDGHVDWPRLRTFGGSQDAAFEEVCKQIFASKAVASGGVWIPKGKNDGGVEGYAVMPNGDEWGIQAKWFLTSPTPKQWDEVDGSVLRALDRHPKLNRYVICMPTDLSDSRTPGTKTARGIWETRKTKYEKWAADRGMSVSFEFNGSSELVSDLMGTSMRGLSAYWFGGPELSSAWLERLQEDATKFAGPRYSPALNVELPLSRLIEALSLNQHFVARVFVLYRELKARDGVLTKKVVTETDAAVTASISELRSKVMLGIEPLATDNAAAIEWDTIAQQADMAADLCNDLSRTLYAAGELKGANSKARYDSNRNKFEHETHELWRLGNALRRIATFAESDEVRLSRKPFLLLVGPGGSGKTHFFCDSASRVIASGNVAVLTFGERFTGREAWIEIGQQTGLPENHEVLLGAINAAAEAQGQRALIFIDAINEGVDGAFWNSRLNVIAGQVARYSSVALVVSVRDTFEKLCVTSEARLSFIRVEHEGFAYDIVEAQRAFFKNYNIVEPSAPLLLPEFANPLFLKLLCEGIAEEGGREFPRGMSGISSIFNFYIRAQNKKISKAIDADPEDNLVQRAIDAFAASLVKANRSELERADAKAIVDAITPSTQGWEKSLFNQLCREGILAEIPIGDSTYVRFAYERFFDHARATHLLNALGGNFAQLADPATQIGSLVKSARDFTARTQGVYEALMVQVPEISGKELFEYLEAPYELWEVQRFLQSLPWRKPETVSPTTCDYFFELLEDKRIRSDVVDCLLSCSLIENHGLNSRALHAHLEPLDMSKRDVLWTIPISEQRHEMSAVDRMIGWARAGAFGAAGASSNAFESRLAAITSLMWLCTSTNRSVRDNATKAIVTILDRDVELYPALFERFRNCNDAYVLQRLYAALGGSVMRQKAAASSATRLAAAIIEQAQTTGLPVDLLTRDYARSIVEKSISLGAVFSETDLSSVTPPYGASTPDLSEDDDTLFEKYSWSKTEHLTGGERAALRGILTIHGSLDSHGDFSRYIIGTNSSRGDWIDVRLEVPPPRTAGVLMRELEKSLNQEQADALRSLNEMSWFASYRVVHEDGSSEAIASPDGALAKIEVEKAGNESDVDATRERFEKLLSPEQLAVFHESKSAPKELPRVSLHAGARWMFRRVLGFGYAGDELNEFDERASKEAWTSGAGRQPATIERIGKKYQWIAYYEFAARMVDNYHLSGWHSDSIDTYQVPSQVRGHDIDPSNLLTETKRPSFDPHAQSWWAGDRFDAWRDDLSLPAWMVTAEGLPDVATALQVSDPDGTAWLALDVHLDWREQESILEDKYDMPRRELWSLLHGYLVPKSQAKRVFDWLKEQNFYGAWLDPKPRDAYEILWGELYWSPAFKFDPFGLGIPADFLDDVETKEPEELLTSAVGYYLREKTRDNSIDDTLHVGFPIKEIVDGMGGCASLPEAGAWIDTGGNIVAFDPSTAVEGPPSVLARRDRLTAYLKNSEFALMWVYLSEKQVVGGHGRPDSSKPFVVSGAYWLEELPDGEFVLRGLSSQVTPE